MDARPASSRILTLVFTDLADSTELKTTRGDRASGVLIDRHRAEVAAIADATRGRIVGWAGDGCFLTFETPSAAVDFALRLQRVHRDVPELPRVRIGVHMGEVSELIDDSGHHDAEGLTVDLASRVAALARPGQVLMSSTVADAARHRIDDRPFGGAPTWTSHGAWALKGFDRPLEIVEAVLPGEVPIGAPSDGEKAHRIDPPGGTSSRLVRVGLAVAAILVAAIVYRQGVAPPTPRPTATSSIRSLAVLPFANYSNDPEQDFFVDGMTESLIAELSKVERLKVISRTSAMHYKNTEKALTEVARELGVDAIVEGSILRAGDDVRITAQLIDGTTDEHLWTESYTARLDDVLQLQADVAFAITREIRGAVTPAVERRRAAAHRVNPEAHVALLKGRKFADEFSPSGFERAERFYREALTHDPDYAAAYARLSYIFWVPAIQGWNRRPDYPVARALAYEALRLDPDSVDGHLSVGWISAVYEWEWEKAEASFRHALALDPSSEFARFGLCDLLAHLGRYDEAVEAIAVALDRDPLSVLYPWDLAFAHNMAGEPEAALRALDGLFEIAPRFAPGFVDAAFAYLALGRPDDAIRMSSQAIAIDGSPTNRVNHAAILAGAGRRTEADALLRATLEDAADAYVSPAYVARAWGMLGEAAQAARWVERALDERDYNVVSLARAPEFEEARRVPAVKEQLERLGLPR